MRHRFKLLLERRLVFWFVGLYCAVSLIAWLPLGDWWSSLSWRYFRFALLGIAAADYGVLRVLRTHPYANSSHRRWLAHNPWRRGKPLPLGPIHIVWEDLVVLAALSSLLFVDAAPWDAVRLAPALAMGFFAAYLVVLLCATAVASVWTPTVICLFLIPLIVYPSCSMAGTFVVLAAIYAILLWGVRLALDEFPFNEPEWRSTPAERYLEQAIGDGTIGWPHNVIGPRSTTRGIGLGTTAVVSALAAWWVHVSVGVFAESWKDVADSLVDSVILGFFTVVCLLVAAIRVIVYVNGFYPPIGFFGRLLTGRWIIPRYDVILVGPICIVLFGVYGPTVLRYGGGVPDAALLAVLVFLLCVIAMGIGPRLETWSHTGRHRVGKKCMLPTSQQSQLQHRERVPGRPAPASR